MTEIAATSAFVTGLSVRCPVCEEESFIFDELTIDDSGATVVAVEDAFDHCPHCGTFVDMSNISISIMIGNPNDDP